MSPATGIALCRPFIGLRGLGTRGVALVVAVVVTLGAGAAARAQTLVADLSQHLVAITTGFSGADVLLFGAVEGEGDVVVIVRGPERPAVVHRKQRLLGIWVNAAKMTFDRAPSFYSVSSSRPLEEIALPTVRARREMGLDFLQLELPRARVSPNLAAEWRAGLVRNYQRLGLYPVEIGAVVFLGSRLFRANLQLPANVPTGIYQVQVYLLREGRVAAAQTTPLAISKIGTEAWVFDFAHKYAASYGLIAIAIALVAGWLAHLAFRKP